MNIDLSTLFRAPPMPPFSYQLDNGTLLSTFLLTGASIVLNKQMHEADERDILRLREYLLSIGWDADYQLATLDNEVLDYYPNGTPYIRNLRLNNWQITFKPADRSLEPQNDFY